MGGLSRYGRSEVGQGDGCRAFGECNDEAAPHPWARLHGLQDRLTLGWHVLYLKLKCSDGLDR